MLSSFAGLGSCQKWRSPRPLQRLLCQHRLQRPLTQSTLSQAMTARAMNGLPMLIRHCIASYQPSCSHRSTRATNRAWLQTIASVVEDVCRAICTCHDCYAFDEWWCTNGPCTIVVQFQATDVIVDVQRIQYGTMITETAHTFTLITILSDLEASHGRSIGFCVSTVADVS